MDAKWYEIFTRSEDFVLLRAEHIESVEIVYHDIEPDADADAKLAADLKFTMVSGATHLLWEDDLAALTELWEALDLGQEINSTSDDRKERFAAQAASYAARQAVKPEESS